MSGYGDFITKLARDLTDFLTGRPDVDLEAIDHLTPLPTFDLGKARTNKKIYSRSGCRIFVTSLTGTAYLRTKIRGEKYSLFKGSLSFPFRELYLTNTAQAGKTLSVVIGLQSFVDLNAQPEFSSSGLATEVTLALIKAKTDNLDLAITALRDAITDGTTPKDLKDLWDKLTSNIAHLARINSAGTEAGYTNIYDLEVKLESLKGAIPKTLWDIWDKLLRLPKKATTTNTYTVTMTNADQEYTQALPTDTAQITFSVRGGGVIFLYAWTPGKVGGTPSDPYTEVPAHGIVCLDKLDLDTKTLYFACGTAGKKMQIEVLV